MADTVEVEHDKPIIERIIEDHIDKLEEEVKLLEEDITRLKRNSDLWLKTQREKEAQPQIDFKLTSYRLGLYEQQIVKLSNEIITYKNSFNRELIDDIEYELYCAKLINNTDHKYEDFIPSELSYIYESIVIARVNILAFKQSSLGENDYSKDMAAIDKKIKDVQEFTFVDTNFKYPELPHVIIQKLIFTLCDEKKSQFSSVPFQPVDKKVIKLIGNLLSGKKRAPKEQRNLIAKERKKFRLRERFRHL